MWIKNIFTDRGGDIVIGQRPNLPIWVAFLFYLLSIVPYPILQPFSFWGMAGSLLYWSYLEILDGVNKFRKLLGAIVATSQIIRIMNFL
jgi:hypothetical protein